MGLKERVEDNVALFVILMVVTGFLAGIGTYKAILDIAHLAVVPEGSDVDSLHREVEKLESENRKLVAENEEIKKNNVELARHIDVLAAKLLEGSNPKPVTGSSQDNVQGTHDLPPTLTSPKTTSGKITVTLRDGTADEYDDVLYSTPKPPSWDFDIYTKITDAGLDTQRNFPLANVRVIDIGEELKVGRYQTHVFVAKVELLNGVKAQGWQYGARNFFLIAKELPAATRQELGTVKRIEFSR